MNLMHLLAKKDPNLQLAGDISQVKTKIDGHTYTGLSLPIGSVVRLKTALRWYPFNTRPFSPGWLVQSNVKSAREPLAQSLEVAFESPNGDRIASNVDRAEPQGGAVHLPLLRGALTRRQSEELDLVVRNASEAGGPVTLLVTETVPTEPLYAQARGYGVELGPGPYPRLLSDAERTVHYVERDPIEQWLHKYNYSGKFKTLDSPEAMELWKHYAVGLAHSIPFDNGSLDFIFSADVFEHLVNPIGHLEYWRSKLKPGGKLLKIVPYIAGCGDYRNRPTDFDWWRGQYEKGGFEETPEHHFAYASVRNLDPSDLHRRGLSSHFSFFSPENLSRMLDFAVENLGFTGFNLHHGRNAKKIHFELYN